MRTVELALNQIEAGHDTQARVQLDWIALEEYAGLMREGVGFPPVVVYSDGDEYWLADGFHRLAAARQAERKTIEVQIEPGGKRDAMLHACGANANHGVRRTNADKRRAVELLLQDEEWRQWSDREIARRCAVSPQTVNNIRSELTVQNGQIDTPRKATRNGSTYTMDTTNIGNEKVEVEYPQESGTWAAGAVGLDRDWSKKELDEYAEATGVRIQPRPDNPESNMAVHFSSDTPEHYTPQHIVDCILQMWDVIDLDPCSNSVRSPRIPARVNFTKNENGLSRQWFGKVYMNPPYGDEIGRWVRRLCWVYEHGHIDEAIALVPARTDTKWFAELDQFYPLICYVTGRLKFDGSSTGNAPFPSAIFYFGPNIAEFVGAFGELGRIQQTLNSEMYGA